ncbi:hypothetical protein LCGC14_0427590 [marine sediment metagenome]|uniref:Uncharacterized protein n=1 Tax=marine sediment metagenome TaxID=412755 RepID=A0A0F9SVD6_9ZZZZ
MSPSNAFASHIAWGEETTWGTPVAPTKFSELVSESLVGANPQLPAEAVRNVTRHRFFPGVKSHGGSFEVELMYDGYLRLFEYLMGEGTSLLTGGALAFEHTFKFIDALPVGLTFEVERDQVAWRYEGSLIDGATFTMEPDQILRASWNIVGQQGIEQATPASFVAPPEEMVLHTELTGKIDTAPFTVLGATVAVANNLQADKKAVGVADIVKPVRGDHRDITGTITIDLDDNAELTRYLATPATEFRLDLEYKNSVAIETTFFRQVFFAMTKCHFTDFPANIGGAGPIIVTLPFTAMFDTGGAIDALEIRIQNEETAVA